MKVPEPKQLPSGSWNINMMIDRKRISITRPTRKECIRAAEQEKAAHELGVSTTRRSTLRLGEAIDRYIESRSNVLSPATIRAYKAYRKERFQPYMMMTIDKIPYQQMVNLEARDKSPKTIKNAWGLVKSVLAENGISASVRLPAPKPPEKLWLTPEQIPAFVEAVKGTPGEIGALLALSGLRRSEVYGLDWAHIDLDARIIHIRRSVVLDENAAPVTRDKNKNALSTRDVPIFLPALYSALCGVEKKEGPVVPGNLSTLRKRITRACQKANLPDIGVHGLRHSFCSLCYSLGIPELECMRLGGWSDYQTMRKIYTHISEADHQKSVSALENFFQITDELQTENSETA